MVKIYKFITAHPWWGFIIQAFLASFSGALISGFVVDRGEGWSWPWFLVYLGVYVVVYMAFQILIIDRARRWKNSQ